ncbi:AAA family ATPase [Variovorax paradoxus]|uniref:AAA family ATPase n=1 Tax=Variovorax paradoxus TaxID=34073 RepID=UPI001ABD178B
MSAKPEDVRVEPVSLDGAAPENSPLAEVDMLDTSPTLKALPPEAEATARSAPAPHLPSRGRFAPYTSDEFRLFPEAESAIEGLLPAQGIGCIYGPAGAGKSVLLTSMLPALAEGTEWFGRTVKLCTVWCVALEGAAGQRNRVEAIEKHYGRRLPPSVKFTFNDLRLNQHEDVAELAARIEKHGGADVVIIDTLACAMAGGDENSSRDMGLVVAGAKTLQRATGGLVLLVHHTGKDASRGLRGHSSLNAALDACIEVKRHEDYRSWKLVKSRDSEDGVQGAFDLQRVEVRIDSKGRPVSSIVAVPVEMPDEDDRPSGPVHKNQIAALACLKAQIAEVEGLDGVDRITFERSAAIDAVKAVMTGDARHRKERAAEAIDGLLKGGFLAEYDGEISLPEVLDED